ncbi:hypothetical protein D3C77_696770 [compost metagenome]
MPDHQVAAYPAGDDGGRYRRGEQPVKDPQWRIPQFDMTHVSPLSNPNRHGRCGRAAARVTAVRSAGSRPAVAPRRADYGTPAGMDARGGHAYDCAPQRIRSSAG